MEAIKAIARRTKAGKCKIDLPINNSAAEIAVMVILEDEKKENEKKTIGDFAGKLKWKGDPLAYQKSIRNEWG
ncbi:MAG: hypothetical protein ABIN01_01975 [Ferruginibacter sp.]